jgi:L,D-peptidoglycan transpeptidase YkuD (ErfK/YbiS/YcfS/YnhG family)
LQNAAELTVRSRAANSSRGRVSLGGLSFPCALGRGGISRRKREGDGATPAGIHPLRRVLYRLDRIRAPVTGLPVSPLRPDDGWCDAPGDRNYNRPVRLPYPASRECLWREDGLYDIIVIIGYNERPRVHGLGSAIFMHLAREDYAPTAGCVALTKPHLLTLLRHCGPETRLRIAP